MLERAGAMEKIKPEDVFIIPAEAALNYLASQYDDSNIQELVRSGLLMVRNLVEERIPTAPVERKAALVAISDNLESEIKRIENR